MSEVINRVKLKRELALLVGALHAHAGGQTLLVEREVDALLGNVVPDALAVALAQERQTALALDEVVLGHRAVGRRDLVALHARVLVRAVGAVGAVGRADALLVLANAEELGLLVAVLVEDLSAVAVARAVALEAVELLGRQGLDRVT